MDKVLMFFVAIITLIAGLIGTVVTVALYGAVGYGLYLAAQHFGFIG